MLGWFQLRCRVFQWWLRRLLSVRSVMEMELEQVKEEVWSKLAGLSPTELTEITVGLSLTVPESKKEKKSALYGAVVKHLMSEVVEEADDDGAALFKLVNTIMDQLIDRREIKVEATTVVPKVEGSGLGGSGSSKGPTVPASTAPASTTPVSTTPPSVTGAAAVTATTSATVSVSPASVATVGSTAGESPVELAAKLLASLGMSRPAMSSVVQPPVSGRQVTGQVQKLKDFKIVGTVGCGEGQLDYAALMYKIREGKSKGYGPADIISGVIAAMKPGSQLRRLFEITPDITEEAFHLMLKSQYDIVNATKCLTELSGCVQEPTQGDQEYMTKMMRLKNTLLVVADEEGFHMDAKSIYQSFVDAVSVGLRNTAIRLELQPILEKRLTDDKLSWEVNKIVTRDEEHRRKMKGSKNASANALDVDKGDSGVPKNNSSMTKEDLILSELRNLSSDVKELKTVKEDVQVIKKRMDGYDQKLSELTRKVEAGGNEDKTGAGDGSDKNNSKRPSFKCEACHKDNKRWCSHCHKCGESGHKRNECPKK